MKRKIQLANSTEAWDANKRYKVNAIVLHNSLDWQNTNGKNSEPGDGDDWITSKSISTLQETSNAGGFDNGSTLKKGTINAGKGGNNGIALRCSLDYELKWEAGRLYVMQQDGFTIRESRYNFNIVPELEDNDLLGYVVGSRWYLDDGTVYVCTDITDNFATWEIEISGVPSLQSVTDVGFVTNNGLVAQALVADGGGFFFLQESLGGTGYIGIYRTNGHLLFQASLTGSTFEINGDNLTAPRVYTAPNQNGRLTVLDTASNYASDALAASAGIPIGGLYHTAGAVKIRLT